MRCRCCCCFILISFFSDRSGINATFMGLVLEYLASSQIYGRMDGLSDSIALKVSIKICTRHSANNDRTNQNKKPTRTAMLMDTLITEYNSTKNNKSQSRGGQRTESKFTLFMLVKNLEMHPQHTYIYTDSPNEDIEGRPTAKQKQLTKNFR